MDTIIAIETYLDFVEQLENIERYIPDTDFNHGTEYKQNEIGDETRTKIISVFKEYITWLVEENGVLQHKIYIRKSYEILWKTHNSYSISSVLGDDVNGGGELWNQFLKIYKEKNQK